MEMLSSVSRSSLTFSKIKSTARRPSVRAKLNSHLKDNKKDNSHKELSMEGPSQLPRTQA